MINISMKSQLHRDTVSEEIIFLIIVFLIFCILISIAINNYKQSAKTHTADRKLL